MRYMALVRRRWEAKEGCGGGGECEQRNRFSARFVQAPTFSFKKKQFCGESRWRHSASASKMAEGGELGAVGVLIVGGVASSLMYGWAHLSAVLAGACARFATGSLIYGNILSAQWLRAMEQDRKRPIREWITARYPMQMCMASSAASSLLHAVVCVEVMTRILHESPTTAGVAWTAVVLATPQVATFHNALWEQRPLVLVAIHAVESVLATAIQCAVVGFML